jgi:hypothetical protein
MSQTMSVTDTIYSPARGAKAATRRQSDVRGGRSHSAHRPVAVPGLDWAADLFADNATIADLIEDDFPLPPHISAVLFGQPDSETHTHTSH